LFSGKILTEVRETKQPNQTGKREGRGAGELREVSSQLLPVSLRRSRVEANGRETKKARDRTRGKMQELGKEEKAIPYMLPIPGLSRDQVW